MIINEIWHKLATWAESDRNRMFDRLLPEGIVEAVRMVLASSGARTPGIDGLDKRRLQVKLDQHLDDLRTSLLEGWPLEDHYLRGRAIGLDPIQFTDRWTPPSAIGAVPLRVISTSLRRAWAPQ